MLSPNQQIKPIDYLHFIFPFLVIIGLMPDLMLSDTEKTTILDNYYEHNNFLLMRKAGLIPPGILQPVSIVLGLIYGSLSFGMIYHTQKNAGNSFTYFNKQTLLWLKLLSLSIFLYFGLQLYQNLNLFMNHTFNPPSQIIKCLVGILLFSYFIGTPNVQENMDGCIVPSDETNSNDIPTISEIYPSLLQNFRDDEMLFK
jgi:hypothetical protein